MKRSVEFLRAEVDCALLKLQFAQQDYEDARRDLYEAVKERNFNRQLEQKLFLLKSAQ